MKQRQRRHRIIRAQNRDGGLQQPWQKQQCDGRGGDIEAQMSEGNPFCGAGRPDRGENRGRGRADTGAHDQNRRLLETQRSARGRAEHDGDGRAGGLGQQRHRDADGQIGRIFARHAPQQVGQRHHPRRQVGKARLQRGDTQEERAKARQRLARAADPASRQHPPDHAQAQQWQGQRADAETRAHQRHDPAGHGIAQIGAIDDPDQIGETHQPGIGEADTGHRHRAGGLQHRRHRCADGKGTPARPGGRFQRRFQRWPGRPGQPGGHHLHPQQKQADTAQKIGPDRAHTPIAAGFSFPQQMT